MSQKESSVFWKVIVSAIPSKKKKKNKKVYIYVPYFEQFPRYLTVQSQRF